LLTARLSPGTKIVIPTSSMVPALQLGDRILVLKAFFNGHGLHEGDIVVFTRPPRDHCGGPAGDDLVKRVMSRTCPVPIHWVGAVGDLGPARPAGGLVPDRPTAANPTR
jgi:signal peptidase I